MADELLDIGNEKKIKTIVTDDAIIGTDDDDDINNEGSGKKKKIYGGKGKDKIKGSDKGDEIYGGKGDDDCKGGKDKDKIYGGRGNDNCSGDDGDDEISGNEGDDKISGGAGKDSLFGGKGDDQCDGEDGDDNISGDTGNDSLTGGAGNDSLTGGVGNDTTVGGTGNDTLDAGEGNDSLDAGEGNDSCKGGAGNDSLSGGAGNDSLDAGEGNDLCDGGDGNDSLSGGAGNDTLSGGAGNDTMAAGEGNNSLEGGAGEDSLQGGTGDNTLSGGAGNDTIVGGTGNHTCIGGEGVDSFIINNATSGGKSIVTDYTDNLDKFLLGEGVSFSSLSFVQVGINTEIRSSSNFVLAVLLNISATILEVSDFLQISNSNSTTSPVAIPVTTSTPTPTPTPTSTVTTPTVEANKELTLVAGTLQVITIDALRFFSGSETGPSGIIYKLNKLPDSSTGQLFYKGQAITSVGFTFTQLDISLKLVTFQAAAGFTGDAGFDFDVTDGQTVISGQSFKLKVFNTTFNFVGSTTPQTIAGSPLDDSIETGDGGDEVKGGKGSDKVKGGKGNDKIEGGEGDDEIEGGEGKNTLTGGVGKDRFSYKKARQGVTKIEDADLITDFNADEDTIEFSTAAFGNIVIGNFKKLKITANILTIDESSNLLDFSDDDSVFDIESLQKRFKAFGRNDNRGRFCQFMDRATGRAVLVFSLGIRFEIISVFATRITLDIKNFVFSGPELPIPKGTDGPDIIDFASSPAPVTYDGLGGNDTIGGSNFDDEFIGGDGDDAIAGAGGKDLLKGGPGADIFSYMNTKEGGDKIVDFTSGVDKFRFVSGAFGNLNGSNFDLVNITSPNTDIAGKELLIFSGTYASLGDVQKQFAALPGAGKAGPVFCMFKNAAGESILVFDSDGVGPAPTVEIANLGTGITGLGTADFLFDGTVPAPMMPPMNSVVDLMASGNTYPSAVNDFSTNVGGYGFSGPVLFMGDGKANSVTATAFADILIGGGGADFLTGGSGADIFSYKAPLDGGDTITDFVVGVDKFEFVAATFGNMTTANFDAVSGPTPDITDKELVIFTGGTYAKFEDAQAKATGSNTNPGFFTFSNAANETVLVFDSNGTTAGGFTTVAMLKNGPVSLGTADFVFTGTIPPKAPPAPLPPVNSTVDLMASGNTYPSAVNDFSTNAGGYGFSGPVLFMGDGKANSVTATAFADILIGGGGADFLTGGSGADIFSYKAPIDGGDTITDFVVGVDKFEFVAATFGNMTTANFDAVSGPTPDITDKELVIFTGGTYAKFEDAQAKATGSNTNPGFFTFSNAANETVLVFDSNGTNAGGFTTVAVLGSSPVTLGVGDFVFTGTIAPKAPPAPLPPVSSTVDLTASGNTYPVSNLNFSTSAGGYGFSGPVLFIGDAGANNVTGTAFSDILNAGGGNDTLSGGGGNDTLTGGTGVDSLDGGAGNDVFVFSGTDAAGSDFITNFSTADDLIRLNSTGFSGFGTGTLGSSFYVYNNNTGSTVAQIEATLTTAPAIIAIYDGASSKLYYDSNGSTVGGNSLFATLNIDFGASGNSKLLLF
ncbi:hypothetical protein BCD67_10340 [Oscillatoriales cyanobacterium USR001]|nr:hypothetical protein BCD67_10340 [Oscillatoriales cyanobacterium USR001]